MALDGLVPATSLLASADYDFICLLGPYDETVLQASKDAVRTGFRRDLLEPAFPIDEAEFYIVGLTADHADFNRYDRRDLDVLSVFDNLDQTAHHIRDNRALCGRTADISFYLLSKGNRRAMGIGLIRTEVSSG